MEVYIVQKHVLDLTLRKVEGLSRTVHQGQVHPVPLKDHRYRAGHTVVECHLPNKDTGRDFYLAFGNFHSDVHDSWGATCNLIMWREEGRGNEFLRNRYRIIDAERYDFRIRRGFPL